MFEHLGDKAQKQQRQDRPKRLAEPDIYPLLNKAQRGQQPDQLKRTPWQCCRCGLVLPHYCIVGRTLEGNDLTFCYDCAQKEYACLEQHAKK